MSKEERSWNNLYRYRNLKAQEVERYVSNDMGATLAVMNEFITFYPKGIRGSKSKSEGDEININTRRDLMEFVRWFDNYKCA